MISHVTVGTKDMQAAQRFYAALFAILGWRNAFAEKQWAAWRPADADRPLFIVMPPQDGKPQSVGNGQMIGLIASNRDRVDAAHAEAMAMGAADEGAPGLRPQYHPDFYGAYFRDPDGNKLCVCCHAAV